MKTAGEILKEERNKKGITLVEAEAATKIRKKTLAALEESDWSKIPSTFSKGLIKNYAVYLGLDENKVLAFFRREYDEKKASSPKPPAGEKKRFYLTPTFVSIFLIGIAVIAVGAYLFTQYRSFTAAPKLEIAQPPDNLEISSREVGVVGQTWSDAEVKINGEPVQLTPGGTFSVSVGLKEGVNVLVISAANRFGAVSSEKRTVVVKDPISQFRLGESTVGLVELTLEITEKPTFVSVEVDGKKFFDGLMVADSSTTFEGQESIKIKTNDAGNTLVTIAGQRSPLGEKGEIVEKVFTN